MNLRHLIQSRFRGRIHPPRRTLRQVRTPLQRQRLGGRRKLLDGLSLRIRKMTIELLLLYTYRERLYDRHDRHDLYIRLRDTRYEQPPARQSVFAMLRLTIQDF